MKLAGGQIAGFIASPPSSVSAALVYGPDEGLVRERAQALLEAVLGPDKDDPFRLALLSGDAVRHDEALLVDEAAALSLVGGRRLIRVRDATDGVAKSLERVLSAPGGHSLVVVEAGDLPARSPLRKLVESAANGAAIPCYADGPKEIAELIRETLGRRNIQIAEDAVIYLIESLGGDRYITRQELEKLSLAVGDGGKVAFTDAVATVGESSALVIEDMIYDAFDGKPHAVERALDRLFAEGESPVGILRAAQRHAHRLHLSLAKIASGASIEAIIKSERIYFRYEPRYRAQLRDWTADRILQCLSRLSQAELDCKSTGMPDETICRRVLSTLVRKGR